MTTTTERPQEHTPLLVSQESLPTTRHYGKATVPETILNLMKTCAGTGILGLPFACQQGGILVFVVGLLGIAGWNAYAVQRLCSCLEYLPDDTLEDDEEENLQQSSKGRRALPPEGTSMLGKVAWHAFGHAGLQTLDYMMMILLFGIIVAYEAAIISFWGDTPLSLGPLVDALSGALVMAFLAMVPDLGALSKASATGLSILLATFFVIAGYGIRSYDYGSSSSLTIWPDSLTGISHWFGVCVFGFGVVPLTYNYQASMIEPDKMVYATLVALTGVALAYIVWGLSLYALYPDLTGEILHELPSTGILPILTRLAMVSVVFMTAPLLIVPCGELLEGKWQIHNRVVVRFGTCLVSAAIAVLLPGFVEVLSLVGCACVGLVGFCIPPLLHLRLASRSASRVVIVTDSILLAWGITATIISTIYTFGRKSEA